MNIVVNGKEQELDHSVSVKQLLQILDLKGDRVAVEVNLEIVDRQKFDDYKIKEGDKVEVIHFVGGGSLHRLC